MGEDISPPQGKKCEKMELNSSASGSGLEQEATGSEIEMDSHNIPSTSKTSPPSSTQETQQEIQRQILNQLQKVNQRLDKVEGRMSREQHGNDGHDNKHSTKKLSKLSKKHFAVLSDSSQSSSESSDEEQCIPTLNKIRKSEKIQRQVDKRIRELEKQSEIAGTLGKLSQNVGGL